MLNLLGSPGILRPVRFAMRQVRPIGSALMALALGVAMLGGLGGCASAGLGGAVLGGATGAALGQAIGQSTAGTLIGTAIGIATGNAIGNEIDKQEAYYANSGFRAPYGHRFVASFPDSDTPASQSHDLPATTAPAPATAPTSQAAPAPTKTIVVQQPVIVERRVHTYHSTPPVIIQPWGYRSYHHHRYHYGGGYYRGGYWGHGARFRAGVCW